VSSDDQTTDSDEDVDYEARIAELEEELTATRRSLRKANKQAAERRIRLRELNEQMSDDEDDESSDEDLQRELRIVRRQVRSYELREEASEVIDNMDISFISARARSDAINFVRQEIEDEFEDDDDEPTEEDYRIAVKKVIKARPYLVKPKKAPPSTDSNKRGASDGLSLDEKEISTQFGIKPI